METGKGAERLQKASELWSRWGWGPVPGVQDLQETSIGWGSVAAQAVGLASSGTPRCTPPPPALYCTSTPQSSVSCSFS